MQEISGEREGFAVAGTKFLRGAVKRVAYHRMTERSEMHTNLVGSAGVDSQFEQCDLAETGIDSTLHGVMRDGFTATLAAALAFVGLDLYTGSTIPAIGASGAVSGVMMLYTMQFPTSLIMIFWLFQVERTSFFLI